MKANTRHLKESHRRQFHGEDWQAVAQDICDGIPGATEEDFLFLSSSPDPGCDCGFCAAAKWQNQPRTYEGRFPLGKTVITSNARSRLTDFEASESLKRHHRGDWGDVVDPKENERSLAEGGRLLSVYHTSDGVKFWIITEADRFVTTILLPEDY